jgi:ATP-dependent DNA ligase
MLRMRTLPSSFIEPCLPTKADTLPSDGLWIHEIKHDGFRIVARKNGAQVKLYSRLGNDLTPESLARANRLRFGLINSRSAPDLIAPPLHRIRMSVRVNLSGG